MNESLKNKYIKCLLRSDGLIEMKNLRRDLSKRELLNKKFDHLQNYDQSEKLSIE
jgi:hypothetical protein